LSSPHGQACQAQSSQSAQTGDRPSGTTAFATITVQATPQAAVPNIQAAALAASAASPAAAADNSSLITLNGDTLTVHGTGVTTISSSSPAR
jgi:hypothetical protein